MTDLFLRAVLPMGLAGTLCYLLLLPLRPLLARLKAGWKRAALLGCAALFLLPLPLLALLPVGQGGLAAAPTPVYSVGKALGQAARTPSAPPAAPPVEESAQGVPALPNNAGSTADTQAQLPGLFAGLNLPRLAAALYGAGAAAALAVFALGHRRLARRLNRGARPETDAETLTLYAGLCKELGVKRAPALLVCGEITAPVLAGVWRSRILLPEAEMRPEALRFALRHELSHHKNGDLLFKYLLILVGVLHWYSPAAHLLRRSFAEACEQACDEAVTARLVLAERKSYAATLLDFAGPAPQGPVTAFASPAKRLRARLRRLMAPARPRRALRAVCFVLLCPLLALALLAGCSLAAGASDGAAPGDAPRYVGTASVGSPQSVAISSASPAAEEPTPPSAASVPNPAPPEDAPPAPGTPPEGAMPDYVGLPVTEVIKDIGEYTSIMYMYRSIPDGPLLTELDILSSAVREGSLEGEVISQQPAAGQPRGNEDVILVVRLPGVAENGKEMTYVVSLSSTPLSAAPSPGQLLLPVPDATGSPRGLGGGHRGLDLNAEEGAPIVAAAPGVVMQAEWNYSYGNYVVIAHGEMTTLYAHCKDLLVEKGQSVEAGREIATVGGTGNTGSVHCHFEVNLNGRLENPEDYVQLPPEWRAA